MNRRPKAIFLAVSRGVTTSACAQLRRIFVRYLLKSRMRARIEIHDTVGQTALGLLLAGLDARAISSPRGDETFGCPPAPLADTVGTPVVQVFSLTTLARRRMRLGR